MQKVLQNRILVVSFIIFIVIVIFAIFITQKFGLSLSQRFSGVGNQSSQEEVTVKDKKNIRKITIVQDDSAGCIQVTPDGAVRVFTTCDQTVVQAYRETDTRFINQLLTQARQGKFGVSKKPISGRYFTLIIETDQGSETVYIPHGGGNLPGDGIKDIIDRIIEQVPSPTPIQGESSPTPTSYFTPTPTPTGPWTPTPSELPTPSPTLVEHPFICDFNTSVGGLKKPFNVSNYICSNEPQPGQ